MLFHYLRWWLSAVWVLAALLTFFAADAVSVRGILLLALAAAVPPIIMAALWNNGPPSTVAEILHAVDGQSTRRP